MSSLHNHVLNRIVRLFLRRDFQNNWVNFLPLGYFFFQVFFADFLSDEDDRYATISQEAVEVVLYVSLCHFFMGSDVLSSTMR